MGSTTSKATSNPLDFATKLFNDGPESSEIRSYDYIIVGGGTAGCVLASRLSEDRAVTVLLIEAGSQHGTNFMSSIPFALIKTFHTAIDWAFETTPQKALHGRKLDCFRGKTLGGTSAINASIYHHCAPQDFDRWARLGLNGWSYEELLPYFKRSEGYHSSSQRPDFVEAERGLKGLWTTGRSDTPLAPVTQAAYQACINLGVKEVVDINTPRGTTGVVNWTGHVDDYGRRVSTAVAYLNADVLSRPNLTVAVNTHVDKVTFDVVDGAKRATGVELSTGAFCTPKLLLFSGIGPSSDLAKLDIPVVQDLPAGRYLSEHIGSGGLRYRAKPGVTWDHLRSVLSGVKALSQWYIFGSGPFSTLPIPCAAFIRSDDESLPLRRKGAEDAGKRGDIEPDVPDIEILWAPATVCGPALEDPPAGSLGVTMLAINLHPKSKGYVTLALKDSWADPVIESNYFELESDLDIVVRGVRFTQRLARTEPLASMLDLGSGSFDKSKNIYWIGDVDPDMVTDEELKEFIRENALSEYHPISSARMGTDPKTSVVDSELRVHGVLGLRVVDASVFPTQVTGHPAAVVVAIAERAADLIKGVI